MKYKDEEDINADNQQDNTKEHLRPYMWKKGQSGNIMGRPKGKTMKEYAKEYLEKMNDDERDEWLEGLDKSIVWQMAEGKPRQDTGITLDPSTLAGIKVEIIQPNAIKPESNTDIPQD
jgi:hypothetical protein